MKHKSTVCFSPCCLFGGPHETQVDCLLFTLVSRLRALPKQVECFLITLLSLHKFSLNTSRLLAVHLAVSSEGLTKHKSTAYYSSRCLLAGPHQTHVECLLFASLSPAGPHQTHVECLLFTLLLAGPHQTRVECLLFTLLSPRTQCLNQQRFRPKFSEAS